MRPKTKQVIKDIFSLRMLFTFIHGIAAGLPLLLTGSTLQAWMKEENVDLTVIGAISLVGLPYTVKFLWAPLIDRYVWKKLGKRKGWIFLFQLALTAVIFAMGTMSPGVSLYPVVIVAFFITFFSASQDIVIDAYRREILPDNELGLGSTLYVQGYRVALLISGAGALVISDFFDDSMSVTAGWNKTYMIMAGIMALAAIIGLFAPKVADQENYPRSMKEAVIGPLKEFFTRDGWLLMLAFIFFYKVGDTMAANLSVPFYLDLGFEKTEVAVIAKAFGTISMLIGGFVAGFLIYFFGIMKSLFIFGFLQAISTFGFSILAITGKSIPVLTGVIAFENISAALGTAAFVAYMASITNKRFTGTQYALLSSLMGVPRVIAAAPTGWMAKHMGWFSFFLFCTLIAIPGMLLLVKLIQKDKALIAKSS